MGLPRMVVPRVIERGIEDRLVLWRLIAYLLALLNLGLVRGLCVQLNAVQIEVLSVHGQRSMDSLLSEHFQVRPRELGCMGLMKLDLVLCYPVGCGLHPVVSFLYSGVLALWNFSEVGGHHEGRVVALLPLVAYTYQLACLLHYVRWNFNLANALDYGLVCIFDNA